MERNMEKAVSKPRATNYRYERKFVYTNSLPEDLIATEVLTSSFCFREIFQRRTINNCYFDDTSMSFYHQNVAGDDKRDKYRLRWYGDHFAQINNPVLEIKKKHGAVGDKISFPLQALSLDLEKTTSAALAQAIISNASQLDLHDLTSAMALLQPSLYNSYERRYFLSDCEHFRITIDYNMTFYDVNVSPFSITQASLPDVILELKYPLPHDKESRAITQNLSARLSKNSKYVRGINLINHHLDT